MILFIIFCPSFLFYVNIKKVVIPRQRLGKTVISFICQSVCLSIHLSVCLSVSDLFFSLLRATLINTTCVSCGSLQLRNVWSCSVDFLIFCECFNFNFYFPMRFNISETVTYTACDYYGFLHLITIWLCSVVFVNFLFHL